MASFNVSVGTRDAPDLPVVRRIGFADIFDALRRGIADFGAKPSHYVFLCLIYPVVGVILLTWTSGSNALQLIFPLMSGFALLGPFAAIGLYEISRRREAGLDSSWWHALGVRESPAIPSIVAIGALLVVLFVAWLYTAQALYVWLYGPEPPASFFGFFADVLSTGRGWALIVLGTGIGALFALVALSTTVVAFPLLLDRNVGAAAAIRTSARAVLLNPVPMVLWGLIVGAGLAVGAAPLLVGLALVIPILGHSTWHLYRKVVASPGPADRASRRPGA